MILTPVKTQWRILSTPPMTGAENMLHDLSTMRRLLNGGSTPELRFFRFLRPTVSFGKHQSLDKIRALIPPGWGTVQRPTGGGVVFHERGLCLSLCWRAGQAPLPTQFKDCYTWIHTIILGVLPPVDARLARCEDCIPPSSFAERQCFAQPSPFDVLRGGKKIAGGAFCKKKDVFLYQGSIQELSSNLESRLHIAFRLALR